MLSQGGPDDGAIPGGALIQSGSMLYGATGEGGSNAGSGSIGYGTIFSFDLTTNTENVLHSFAGGITDGMGPFISTPVLNGSTLYVTTEQGGSAGGATGAGTISQYNLATNKESVAYSFTSGPHTDGFEPSGWIIQSGDTLYGTTPLGGSESDGAIFELDLATNTESLLYSFLGSASSDGANPQYGSLVQSGTMLYGTTSQGGSGGRVNRGTIYEYNLTTDSETPLSTFTGGNRLSSDGSQPYGSLIISGSILYGMTRFGGADNDGTIFQYDLTTNIETVLHSFTGGTADGSGPYGSLILSGSTLYGTAPSGGANGDGMIFSLTVPEPTTFSLLALSSVALLARRRKVSDANRYLVVSACLADSTANFRSSSEKHAGVEIEYSQPV